MIQNPHLDYAEWVEHVAQSIAILLSCMDTEDRKQILERAHSIIEAHDATRGVQQQEPQWSGADKQPLAAEQQSQQAQ
ncbi:MAG: hypothetical protein JO316_02450 [Abitibacteriaceae bacterium]|nr:hypothetical protein [Abditibacteriaceae bacterium]MBV9864189.1 hypothetical protein [Abditibacteriaceae bacterium]